MSPELEVQPSSLLNKLKGTLCIALLLEDVPFITTILSVFSKVPESDNWSKSTSKDIVSSDNWLVVNTSPPDNPTPAVRVIDESFADAMLPIFCELVVMF